VDWNGSGDGNAVRWLLSNSLRGWNWMCVKKQNK
jgi:hypothetical protein